MRDARKQSFFWVFHSLRGLHSKVASFTDAAEYLPSSVCVFLGDKHDDGGLTMVCWWRTDVCWWIADCGLIAWTLP